MSGSVVEIVSRVLNISNVRESPRFVQFFEAVKVLE